MLSLYLCTLLTALPSSPLELKAGSAEPGDTVSLHVAGIRVPERTEAGLYLYGTLVAPAHALRALLLRSTDGGAHWIEVLPTVEHNEVLFIQFSACQGRALLGWTVEGPGELTLFASTDCGATWRSRGKLPKEVWSEWPEQMSWKDGQQGMVWLRDANEENAPLRALSTQDGGRTWSSVKQLPPPSVDQPEVEARSTSGVRWKVSSDERNIRVERQEPDAAVEVRALLPANWQRKGKKLVPTQ